MSLLDEGYFLDVFFPPNPFLHPAGMAGGGGNTILELKYHILNGRLAQVGLPTDGFELGLIGIDWFHRHHRGFTDRKFKSVGF